MNVLLKISADVPASPRGPIKVSNVTPKSCDLTWKSSDKDGGLPIIEYIIESSSNDEDWITLGKVDKFKNDFKAKDLEDGKQYVFRVSAINKVGPSKPLLSESIKIQKPPEAPEKPEGPIEVKDIKKESMNVSWQPPKSDGGSPITGYIIEKREQSRNLWARNMITYWMAQNKKKIDQIFGPDYLNKSSMELDGIWATEAEIPSAAAMLNTDIHIYCNTGNENKWLKYKSVILGEKPVTTKSIFLDNSILIMFRFCK